MVLTTMGVEVPIRGEQGAISIDVLGYNIPDATDYWDGNWLRSKATVRVPGYAANLELFVRAEDFTQFLLELEHVALPRAGVATFKTMETQLEFVIEMANQGTCKVSGQISDHIPGGDLRFSFDSDQSYLAETVEALRNVVQRFPVRGNPDA